MDMSTSNNSTIWPENSQSIMDAEKVEKWLSEHQHIPGAIQAQQALDEKVSYHIGIKKEAGGGRFDRFLLIETYKECIDEQLFRHIECDICTLHISNDNLYYVGVM